MGGRRTRVRTRGEFRVRIEPVSVATPVYRRPGVRGSSGWISDFIRPVGYTESEFTRAKTNEENTDFQLVLRW